MPIKTKNTTTMIQEYNTSVIDIDNYTVTDFGNKLIYIRINCKSKTTIQANKLIIVGTLNNQYVSNNYTISGNIVFSIGQKETICGNSIIVPKTGIVSNMTNSDIYNSLNLSSGQIVIKCNNTVYLNDWIYINFIYDLS